MKEPSNAKNHKFDSVSSNNSDFEQYHDGMSSHSSETLVYIWIDGFEEWNHQMLECEPAVALIEIVQPFRLCNTINLWF
jgi:hypothetical protein